MIAVSEEQREGILWMVNYHRIFFLVCRRELCIAGLQEKKLFWIISPKEQGKYSGIRRGNLKVWYEKV